MSALVPALAVPAIRTARIAGLLPFYRDALGFDVPQHVPGTVALLRHGHVRLQLWQQPEQPMPALVRAEVQGGHAEIFALYGRLACRGQGAGLDESPRLRAWGAWEFLLTDPEGNRIVFAQWAVGSVFGNAPGPRAGAGGPHRNASP